MAYRVPMILLAAAMLALAAKPASAQSMDGVAPTQRTNSEYPRTENPPPFEERSRYDPVPLRVNPARLDPGQRQFLDRHDVRLQPYRIFAASGGEVSIVNGRVGSAHNTVIRVGTMIRLCNRGVVFEFPITLSRAAANWSRPDDPNSFTRNRVATKLAPGKCVEITPDQPGTVSFGCDVHAHENWRLMVLPADHDLSEESVQLLLLRLSGGRTGEFAVFTPKPTNPERREMCALPHRWRNEVQGLGSSVWVVDANGRASESGMASVTAKASFSGNVLTIAWQNNVTAFYYRIPLDSSCSGTGELVFTRGSPGRSSYPATFTSLGGGKQ